MAIPVNGVVANGARGARCVRRTGAQRGSVVQPEPQHASGGIRISNERRPCRTHPWDDRRGLPACTVGEMGPAAWVPRSWPVLGWDSPDRQANLCDRGRYGDCGIERPSAKSSRHCRHSPARARPKRSLVAEDPVRRIPGRIGPAVARVDPHRRELGLALLRARPGRRRHRCLTSDLGSWALTTRSQRGRRGARGLGSSPRDETCAECLTRSTRGSALANASAGPSTCGADRYRGRGWGGSTRRR